MDYLSLFPGYIQEKPKFMALAAAGQLVGRNLPDSAAAETEKEHLGRDESAGNSGKGAGHKPSLCRQPVSGVFCCANSKGGFHSTRR